MFDLLSVCFDAKLGQEEETTVFDTKLEKKSFKLN